jgi:hypothetical protein
MEIWYSSDKLEMRLIRAVLSLVLFYKLRNLDPVVACEEAKKTVMW